MAKTRIKVKLKRVKARRRILNVDPVTGEAHLPISGRISAPALRARRKEVLGGIPLAGERKRVKLKKKVKIRRKA